MVCFKGEFVVRLIFIEFWLVLWMFIKSFLFVVLVIRKRWFFNWMEFWGRMRMELKIKNWVGFVSLRELRLMFFLIWMWLFFVVLFRNLINWLRLFGNWSLLIERIVLRFIWFVWNLWCFRVWFNLLKELVCCWWSYELDELRLYCLLSWIFCCWLVGVRYLN